MNDDFYNFLVATDQLDEFLGLKDEACYSPTTDEIVLPESKKFYDEYSYYATQLHEISHSTGSVDSYIGNISEHETRLEHLALTLKQPTWRVYRY